MTVAALLLGCAGRGSAPPSMTPAIGLEQGNVAPELSLLDLAGEPVRLSSFRGQPVMINFWAVWCGFCQIELPEMQEVYEAYRESGFVILAVDVMEEQAPVQSFVDQLGLTFPILLDSKGEVTLLYEVEGLPTSYFVGPDGTILDVRVGPVDREWMETYLGQVGVK